MKRLFFVAFAVLYGCQSPTDPTPPAPSIKIVSVYANDAIDATVEYTVAGELSETFLLIDDERVNVLQRDTLYYGTFPVNASRRMVVAINNGSRTTAGF